MLRSGKSGAAIIMGIHAKRITESCSQSRNQFSVRVLLPFISCMGSWTFVLLITLPTGFDDSFFSTTERMNHMQMVSIF